MYKTEKIEKFLHRFTDQRLAILQAAAENGRLVYQDSCNCFVHHFRGHYSDTKWDPEVGELAREAESEYRAIGEWMDDPDEVRRQVMLPLIHAEWAKRAMPIPVTFAVAELQEA